MKIFLPFFFLMMLFTFAYSARFRVDTVWALKGAYIFDSKTPVAASVDTVIGIIAGDSVARKTTKVKLADSSIASGNADMLDGKHKSYYDTVGNGLFLRLDQTSPQTVINGAPIFGVGVRLSYGAVLDGYNSINNLVNFASIDADNYFNFGTSAVNGFILGQSTARIFGTTVGNGYLNFSTESAANAMRITSTGLIGVNTINPTGLLDLGGSIVLGSDTGFTAPATACAIFKTSAGTTEGFKNTGSLMLRTRVSSAAGRGSFGVYTGSPSLLRFLIREDGSTKISNLPGQTAVTAFVTKRASDSSLCSASVASVWNSLHISDTLDTTISVSPDYYPVLTTGRRLRNGHLLNYNGNVFNYKSFEFNPACSSLSGGSNYPKIGATALVAGKSGIFASNGNLLIQGRSGTDRNISFYNGTDTVYMFGIVGDSYLESNKEHRFLYVETNSEPYFDGTALKGRFKYCWSDGYTHGATTNGYRIKTTVPHARNSQMVWHVTGKNGSEPVDITLSYYASSSSSLSYYTATGFGLDSIYCTQTGTFQTIWIPANSSATGAGKYLELELCTDSSFQYAFADTAIPSASGVYPQWVYVTKLATRQNISDSLNQVIDSLKTGTFRVGLGADTIRINTAGGISLSGAATVWDDMRIIPSTFSFPGNNDPTLVKYSINGSCYDYGYEFNNSDSGWFKFQIPHDYKENSSIKCHIHWTPHARGSSEFNKTVAWGVTLAWGNIGSTFSACTTLVLTDTCDGINYKHLMTQDATIYATGGKTISSIGIGPIFRSDGDSWQTNTSGNLPILLELDFHYEKDGIGSNTSSSK
jgi:hypothetical protein